MMRLHPAYLAATAMLIVSLSGCAPAVQAPDSPGGESVCEQIAENIRVETKYSFQGNVKLGDEALPNVHITVKNSEFSIETCTGSDGKWSVYLPEESTYLVILDGQNLPKGIILSDSGGGWTIVNGNPQTEVEFGLTDKKAVNAFFSKD